MVCLLQCQEGFTVMGPHIVECSPSEQLYQPDTKHSRCLRLPLASPGRVMIHNNSCLPPASVPGGRWRCDSLSTTCVLDCHQGYHSSVPVVLRCCHGQHCLGWHSPTIGVGCTRTDCVDLDPQEKQRWGNSSFSLRNKEDSSGNDLQSEGGESNENQGPPNLNENPSLDNELNEGIESNENEDPNHENNELQSDGSDSKENEDPSEGGESTENDNPSHEDALKSKLDLTFPKD